MTNFIKSLGHGLARCFKAAAAVQIPGVDKAVGGSRIYSRARHLKRLKYCSSIRTAAIRHGRSILNRDFQCILIRTTVIIGCRYKDRIHTIIRKDMLNAGVGPRFTITEIPAYVDQVIHTGIKNRS